jgi:hypothetical protein
LLSAAALLATAACGSADSSHGPEDTASTGEDLVVGGCAPGSHEECTYPDPDQSDIPVSKRKKPVPQCTCVDDPPTISGFVSHVGGVQPGWVRATLQYSAAAQVVWDASVKCSAGSPQSVVVTSKTAGNDAYIDVKANLDWVAANGFQAPCTVSEIDVRASIGNVVDSSTFATSFAVDLPLSHRRPSQIGPITDSAVSLTWDPAKSRYSAYPPRMIAIQSNEGQPALIEVEELPSRGTLGLRAFDGYWYDYMDFEMGGGGELPADPAWGIDVDHLGITKVALPVEESHPGFNKFAYSGPQPAIDTGNRALKIFPAAPLWDDATYYANVLDNRGVPRCRSATGHCIDVTYDAAAHMLRATNGATVRLLDDGPIQPTQAAKMARTLSPTPAQSVRAVSPLHSSTVLEPSAKPLNPVLTIPSGGACPLVTRSKGPLMGTFTRTSVPLTHCAGESANHCPTQADPVRPDALPSWGAGAELSLSNLAPYYEGRDNHKDNCGAHANTQAYETLVNELADDLVAKRAIDVDGDSVTVTEPRLGFSVTGREVGYFNQDGTAFGDQELGTDPAVPPDTTFALFPEAYWPAREGDWDNWAKANTASPSANAVLQHCQDKGWWWSGFCAGQGQPPAGVYRAYSMQMMNVGKNPFSDGVWSLANTHFDMVSQSIALDDRDKAIQDVIAALQGGAPVILSFPAKSREIPDGGSGYVSLLGDMSWYLPPELASCSTYDLSAAFTPSKGHMVNILGYSISGSIASPDVYGSYFIIENNWGKEQGHGGFFTMNFAAFKFLATNLDVRHLDCAYSSKACEHHS